MQTFRYEEKSQAVSFLSWVGGKENIDSLKQTNKGRSSELRGQWELSAQASENFFYRQQPEEQQRSLVQLQREAAKSHG
jgi:hypothetical protein